MTIRSWFWASLVPVLLVAPASSIWALDPSSSPDDADLFKGESVDMYFYQNPFFSFDMTIPGNWYPLSSKELLRALRKEHPGPAYSEQNLKETGQFYLMSISKYAPAQRGPGGKFNPNIIMCAMALSRLQGIRTAKDHIEFLKSTLTAMGVQPTTDPHPIQLGGFEFWRFDGVARGQETRLSAHLSAIRKGYALTFQLSAGGKADMLELEKILQSLHFE